MKRGWRGEGGWTEGEGEGDKTINTASHYNNHATDFSSILFQKIHSNEYMFVLDNTHFIIVESHLFTKLSTKLSTYILTKLLTQCYLNF